MASPTRREFIAASAVTLSAASYNRAASAPNEKVRVAIMGLRVRGLQLAPPFAATPGVEIACLVDPDPSMFNPVLKKLPTSAEIPTATDIRKVLEDKSVTAVVVSAPDHWHALATVGRARLTSTSEAGVAQPGRGARGWSNGGSWVIVQAGAAQPGRCRPARIRQAKTRQVAFARAWCRVASEHQPRK